MGSIPMLNRREELELTRRLAAQRQRYRRAALANWRVIAHVVDTFEHVGDGRMNLERTIDVVPSQGLTAEAIRDRLPGHLAELRQLLADATAEFQQFLTTRIPQARLRPRFGYRAGLRKAVKLVEELSPRTDFLDSWTDELARQAAQLRDLVRQRQAGTRKTLRDLMLEVRATPEELSRLVRVIQRRRAAYRAVRGDLAQANLRLVVSIAKHYRGKGLPFGDLIQEGNSGLMRAVDKFDYRLGWKFGTYATWWIRQGVTRALADHSRMVRVPCHQVATLAEIDRVRGELMVKHGREPADEEVAAALGMTMDDLRALTVVGRAPLSLHEAFAGDDDESWVSFLSDPDTSGPGEAADHHLLKERIGEVLRSLAPRDREVIELRFGLKDGKAHTLDEVAQLLGVTRERIRQIEARGLLRLRQPERRQRLADFSGVG
jgi:RNA polymerase primary sigma factor